MAETFLDGESRTLTAECPAGKRVFGGGAELNSTFLTLNESHAFDFELAGQQHSGWFIDVTNGHGASRDVHVFAICATVG